MISAVGIISLIYNAINMSAINFLLHMISQYVFNQIQFIVVHLSLHAAFIEKSDIEMKSNAGVLIAYNHHYIDTTVFHKYWLPYRLGYFITVGKQIKLNNYIFIYVGL